MTIYNIIWIMYLPPLSVAIFILSPHIFHTLTVFVAGSDNINSCGVDAAVAENICELGNIFFDAVKCSSK